MLHTLFWILIIALTSLEVVQCGVLPNINVTNVRVKGNEARHSFNNLTTNITAKCDQDGKCLIPKNKTSNVEIATNNNTRSTLANTTSPTPMKSSINAQENATTTTFTPVNEDSATTKSFLDSEDESDTDSSTQIIINTQTTRRHRTKDNYVPISLIRTKTVKKITTPRVFIPIKHQVTKPQFQNVGDQYEYNSNGVPDFTILIPFKNSTLKNMATYAEEAVEADQLTTPFFMPFTAFPLKTDVNFFKASPPLIYTNAHWKTSDFSDLPYNTKFTSPPFFIHTNSKTNDNFDIPDKLTTLISTRTRSKTIGSTDMLAKSTPPIFIHTSSKTSDINDVDIAANGKLTSSIFIRTFTKTIGSTDMLAKSTPPLFIRTSSKTSDINDIDITANAKLTSSIFIRTFSKTIGSTDMLAKSTPSIFIRTSSKTGDTSITSTPAIFILTSPKTN